MQNANSCYLPERFFFQAEDGIRVRSVTGVQTCALPIFRLHAGALHGVRGFLEGLHFPLLEELLAIKAAVHQDGMAAAFYRSEERRVGKECRFGESVVV